MARSGSGSCSLKQGPKPNSQRVESGGGFLLVDANNQRSSTGLGSSPSRVYGRRSPFDGSDAFSDFKLTDFVHSTLRTIAAGPIPERVRLSPGDQLGFEGSKP